MPYKVIDVFKDLPRKAGCSDCGKPGCFAFATAAYLEGADLGLCPHLAGDRRAEMARRLAEGRQAGEGVRPEAVEQAAAALISKLAAEPDLAALAERAGARYVAERDAVEVTLLGKTYAARRDGLDALEPGEPPNVWVKVLVLLYLTRATGAPPTGRWIAFRELPSTVGKQKTWEKWVSRIGEAFAGRDGDLEEAARRLGGWPVAHEGASRAFRFDAMPRLPLLLLVWEGDEDFPAQTSLLLDAGALDSLDQESLVFLSEALMRRLLGEEDPAG